LVLEEQQFYFLSCPDSEPLPTAAAFLFAATSVFCRSGCNSTIQTTLYAGIIISFTDVFDAQKTDFKILFQRIDIGKNQQYSINFIERHHSLN
jgi:hypothetical protein